MIKIVETKDFSYAIELDLKDKTTTETREYVENEFRDHLYKCWDAYSGGIRVGVVLSFCIDGIYTIDGFNESKDFMCAVIAGKMACEEIFKVTDTIWTMHLCKHERITLLAEMMGFEKVKIEDDHILLKREKLWEIKPRRPLRLLKSSK